MGNHKANPHSDVRAFAILPLKKRMWRIEFGATWNEFLAGGSESSMRSSYGSFVGGVADEFAVLAALLTGIPG